MMKISGEEGGFLYFFVAKVQKVAEKTRMISLWMMQLSFLATGFLSALV